MIIRYNIMNNYKSNERHGFQNICLKTETLEGRKLKMSWNNLRLETGTKGERGFIL